VIIRIGSRLEEKAESHEQANLYSIQRIRRSRIARMSWQDRITVNPAVRSGKPCIKGTRITVYDVLECLAGA